MVAVSQSGLSLRLDGSRQLEQQDFLHLETVFNLLPKVIFYAKDHRRRWVACNRAALSLLRKQHQSEVLGLREEDFFPRAVAAAISEDDQRVLVQGEQIIDRVELIVNEYGQLVWVKTSKLPVWSQANNVIGLVGVTQLLETQSELPARFEKFRKVIDTIESSLDNLPTVADLASIANMSPSHFRRSFKQCFGLTPQDFVGQQRLRRAAYKITETDSAIAAIALECGFGDQSHFSRKFRLFFGCPPRSYRQQWRP